MGGGEVMKKVSLIMQCSMDSITPLRLCPYMGKFSINSFSSSKLAELFMQARIMRAHSFYLAIDDFA